jgi:pimeloyl-ACP methyl ester carboxylesterase
MPELGTKFRVCALDSIGGWGDTDPFFPANEGIQSRVDHLEAFIDALCLDEVYLAGNSQGAWMVAKYALLHPDRVRKLIYIASNTISNAMGMKSPQTEGMRALRAYDGTEASMRRFLETVVYDKSSITDGLVKLRNASANRPGAAEARRIFQEGTQKLNQDPNMKLKFEMQSTLPRLTIPSMFIWGEEDSFAPVELGRQLEKLLPNIPFKYIPRAGHQVQNDQPEAVIKLMMDFFGA